MPNASRTCWPRRPNWRRPRLEQATWERRVAGLRIRIDGDALDERARAMLNLSDPQDVIVPYEKGKRLF